MFNIRNILGTDDKEEKKNLEVEVKKENDGETMTSFKKTDKVKERLKKNENEFDIDRKSFKTNSKIDLDLQKNSQKGLKKISSFELIFDKKIIKGIEKQIEVGIKDKDENVKGWFDGKKIRSSFSKEQLQQLEIAFQHDIFLSPHHFIFLTTHFNLNYHQIKNWFENRRARYKRELGSSVISNFKSVETDEMKEINKMTKIGEKKIKRNDFFGLKAETTDGLKNELEILKLNEFKMKKNINKDYRINERSTNHNPNTKFNYHNNHFHKYYLPTNFETVYNFHKAMDAFQKLNSQPHKTTYKSPKKTLYKETFQPYSTVNSSSFSRMSRKCKDEEDQVSWAMYDREENFLKRLKCPLQIEVLKRCCFKSFMIRHCTPVSSITSELS